MSRLLPAAMLLAALVAPRTTPQTGYVSRSDPGVFEGVVAHRFANGWWRNTPPDDWQTVAGYAATTDCDQVGKVVLMRPVGAETWERVLVGDCVGDVQTLNWMLDNNIVAELDYELFTRWASAYGVPLAVEMRSGGVRYDYALWRYL